MRFASILILELVLLGSPLVHGAHVLSGQASHSSDAASLTCSRESLSVVDSPAVSCCESATAERTSASPPPSCCSMAVEGLQEATQKLSKNCNDSSGGHCCSCCQDGCYRVVTSASPMWLALSDSTLILKAAGSVLLRNDARVIRPEFPEVPPPKA